MQYNFLFTRKAFISLGLLWACATAYPPPPAPTNAEKDAFRKKITRSLSLLEGGMAIKIVFFGQSLQDAGQKWYQNFGPWIRSEYPSADITITNRSVAGCSSDCLGPQVQTQISGQNADLIIFHVYANSEASYESVIQKIKQYSPATMELLVFNDHVHNSSREWHDLWSGTLLPALAVRNNIGMVNIRDPWKRYLVANHGGDPYNYAALTTDGCHFNDEGQYLILELFKRYITGGGFTNTIDRLSSVRQTAVRSTNAAGTMWDLRGAVLGSQPYYRAKNGVRIVRLDEERSAVKAMVLPVK